MLRQVVDLATSVVLDVPSTGTFVSVHTSIVKPLKPELDLPHKQPLEIPHNTKSLVDLPKMLGEGVVLPPEELVELLGRGGQREAIAELAERLDRVEGILERSKVFVREELRPPVGREPVNRSFAFTNQVPPIDPMQAQPGDMGDMEGGHTANEQHGEAEPQGQ